MAFTGHVVVEPLFEPTEHTRAGVPRSRLHGARAARGRATRLPLRLGSTRGKLCQTMLLRHEGFRRLCLARDLLREQRDITPSIADLAREVRISPFHFIRQFEAVFGVTPHQFRIQMRLDSAKHLLSMGHSVTDVCMEVGFSSLGSFSTLFTRRVGESPSAYRRRVRAMVQVPGTLAGNLIPGCLTLMGHLPSSAFF
jgi:AraC-like DNA-binding protein